MIFNALSAALLADSVDVKLRASQLSLFQDGRKRFVYGEKSFTHLIQTLEMLPLASDVTGLCVCVCDYTVQICLYMTSLSA